MYQTQFRPTCYGLAQLAALCEPSHFIPSTAGPGKSIVIEYSTGAEELLEFDDKTDFEMWSQTNPLYQLQDGAYKVIVKWECVQDGGRYYTDEILYKKVGWPLNQYF
jgi:hypothetical protein